MTQPLAHLISLAPTYPAFLPPIFSIHSWMEGPEDPQAPWGTSWHQGQHVTLQLSHQERPQPQAVQPGRVLSVTTHLHHVSTTLDV